MSDSWIGIDLDGTLAEWTPGQSVWEIGDPIPKMVALVETFIKQGRNVKIFTSRVAASGLTNGHGVVDTPEFAREQRLLIESWCMKHLGYLLPIVATKDFMMEFCLDDRAFRVTTNTGEIEGWTQSMLL